MKKVKERIQNAMSEQEKIQLFEDQKTRTACEASNCEARLMQRLNEEGIGELLTICQQLKMTASDGKCRATDIAIEKKLLKGVMR